jgi:hypothetical protein
MTPSQAHRNTSLHPALNLGKLWTGLRTIYKFCIFIQMLEMNAALWMMVLSSSTPIRTQFRWSMGVSPNHRFCASNLNEAFAAFPFHLNRIICRSFDFVRNYGHLWWALRQMDRLCYDLYWSFLFIRLGNLILRKLWLLGLRRGHQRLDLVMLLVLWRL